MRIDVILFPDQFGSKMMGCVTPELKYKRDDGWEFLMRDQPPPFLGDFLSAVIPG